MQMTDHEQPLLGRLVPALTSVLNAPACHTMSPRCTALTSAACSSAVGHSRVTPLRVKFEGPACGVKSRHLELATA